MKRNAKSHWRYFPDGPDGPFESLRQAILWRNSVWLRLGPPERFATKHARNSSGVVGVSREVQRTPSGRVVEMWAAGWPDADKAYHRRTFTVDKYGESEARAHAVAARKAGLAAADKERRRRWAELLFMQNRMLRNP